MAEWGAVVNFADLAAITNEGTAGLAFQSEDGAWRVTASDTGDPPFTWCVYQRRRATWTHRLPWLALASKEEAFAVAAFLAAYHPLTMGPAEMRDRVEWQARRVLTGLVAYASTRIGEALLRRAKARVEEQLRERQDVDE